MKRSFERLKPRFINYRDYKSCKSKIFWEGLLFELEEYVDGFEKFTEICQKTINYGALT